MRKRRQDATDGPTAKRQHLLDHHHNDEKKEENDDGKKEEASVVSEKDWAWMLKTPTKQRLGKWIQDLQLNTRFPSMPGESINEYWDRNKSVILSNKDIATVLNGLLGEHRQELRIATAKSAKARKSNNAMREDIRSRRKRHVEEFKLSVQWANDSLAGYGGKPLIVIHATSVIGLSGLPKWGWACIPARLIAAEQDLTSNNHTSFKIEVMLCPSENQHRAWLFDQLRNAKRHQKQLGRIPDPYAVALADADDPSTFILDDDEREESLAKQTFRVRILSFPEHNRWSPSDKAPVATHHSEDFRLISDGTNAIYLSTLGEPEPVTTQIRLQLEINLFGPFRLAAFRCLATELSSLGFSGPTIIVIDQYTWSPLVKPEPSSLNPDEKAPTTTTLPWIEVEAIAQAIGDTTTIPWIKAATQGSTSARPSPFTIVPATATGGAGQWYS